MEGQDTECKVYDSLVNGEGSLAVVGLGYVGMPVAVAFAA